MNSDLIKSKLKATAIHLSISIIIFIGILYLILVKWYPEPFFTAEGGWEGIRLMAFVDLVLGPTLTLIVFNHTKRKVEIVLDLSVIVLIQVAALIWGGYQVYSKRPIAMVFFEYAFFTVTADYFKQQGVSNPDLSDFSDRIPPVLAARMPQTEQETQRFKLLTAEKIPVYAQLDLYEPLVNQLDLMKQKQVNIKEIMSENQLMKDDFMSLTDGQIEDFIYLALKAKFHNVILVLDKQGNYKGMVKVHR